MNTNSTGMRDQGSVIEPAKTANGAVVVAPNPYDGHYPVKFSDETEAMYQGRVASFESSYFNSLSNPTLAQAEAHLKAKQERELATLKASYDNKAVKPTTPTPTSSKKVNGVDGKVKIVDADYVLADGERFV